jgi:NitT/TauT family transport system substrate-binding protein
MGAMRTLIGALLTLAILTACGQAAGPAASQSAAASAAKPAVIGFRYGMSGSGGTTNIYRLMNRLDIWGQEGLKAEFIQFQGDPLSNAALQAGELDFAFGGADATLALAFKGAPLRVIGLIQNKFEYHLMGAKGVRSVQDLKGKAVAISKLGSNSDFATREALKRLGLDPTSVTYIQAGNSVQRVAALQSGAVQGSIMSLDYVAQLTDAGFTDLANMSTMDIAFPFQAITTTTATIERRSDLVQRVIRSIYRGVQRFRNDPEEAQKEIASQASETRKEVIQSTWETYRNTIPTDMTPDPRTFAELLKELSEIEPAAKDAKPETYLDLRPVQQVNASGFPKQLFGDKA